MSILFRRRAEERAITIDNTSGAFVSSSGSILGEGLAAPLRLIPLYAGVSLISDVIAGLPLTAFEDGPAGKRRLPTQPQLLRAPMPGGQLFTWKQQAIASVLLRGNAYGLILSRDSELVPETVKWLSPVGMDVDESDVVPHFTYRGRALDASQVLHVPGFVLPGCFKGLSPVALFKEQIQTGLRVDRYTSDWYETGVAPSGHLKNENKTLDRGEAAATKQSFKAAVAGHDMWVSGKDWSWEPLTIPANEALFLETIKASATQIATMLRLAPEDIGGTTGGTSLTYSTLEQNEMKFNRRTALPWTSRFEAVFDTYFPAGQYVKFNLDAGVRADLKTRMESHQLGLTSGVETLDEARALEDRAPLTPEELALWQLLQGKGGGTPEDQARKIAETLQKVYLAVGKVITAEEARDLARQAGAQLGQVPAGWPLPPTKQGK